MASTVTWLTLLALLVAPSTTSFARKGFLLTSPKTFIAGTTERFCVTFFRLYGRVSLNVYLLPKSNSTSAQSVAKFTRSRLRVTGGRSTRCFDMSVPKKTLGSSFYLRASVSGPHFSSTKISVINVLPYTLITLVQTDKSKYKAGQSVRFRVVTLKSDLTAQEEVVKQIYLTTPGGTRLAQWDNVKTRSGIIQEKFLLTQEPPLGMWTIHVKRGDRITKQTFEVAEFTLPRFEVTITGPTYIVKNANTVSLKVCAKYTFGKPVSSAAVVLYAERTVPNYFYRRNRFGVIPVTGTIPSNITLKDEIDSEGCAEFDVLLSKIGVGSRFERSGIYVNRVNFKTNVTETGTGLLLGSDLSIPIQTPRVNVKIDNQAGANFIKPNLKYIGFATVTGADGKPLVNEVLEVCHTETYRDQGALEPIIKSSASNPYLSHKTGRRGVTLTNQDFTKLPIIHLRVPTKSKNGGCREYSSDKNGRIRFQIPPQLPGIIRSQVNIKTKRTGGPSGSASISLKGWFSLTNSFISIVPVTDPSDLKCTGTFKLKVESSVPSPAMTYLVMTRGQIVSSGRVRDGFIQIRLGFNVSPPFKVLVYYANAFGETIADSKTFDVADCFQNRVKVVWNKKQVKPGEQATLTITGAANSLCGVSAVDRSVELLSDKNKLTAKNVFAKLRRFIIGQFASPRLTKSDQSYCTREPRYASAEYFGFHGGEYERTETEMSDNERTILAPGETRSRLVSFRRNYDIYYTYTTVQDDTIKAFDVSGYLPLTNLVLESRPCEEQKRTRYRYRTAATSTDSIGGASARNIRGEDRIVLKTLASAASSATRSVAPVAEAAPVETAVRSLFPETFLFDLQALGRFVVSGRQVAGYLPLTNLVLESRPCEKRNRTRYVRPVYYQRRGSAIDTVSAVRGNADSALPVMAFAASSSGSIGAPESATRVTRPEAGAAPVETAVRSLFPETFLFDLQALGRFVVSRRQVAGYLPLTNLVLESRPCEKQNRTRYVRPFYAYNNLASQSAVASEGGVGARREGRVLVVSKSSATRSAAPVAGAAPVETAVRSLFPETFLFDLQALGPGPSTSQEPSTSSPSASPTSQEPSSQPPSAGSAAITKTMPDTITSWVASAFCSGLKSGFGLSESASITTFKPFFAQIQVPYSVKRGELLRLKISVFNFLSKDLSVAVVLAPSSDYSVEAGGVSTQTVCVRASKPSVVDFPLQFSSLGKVEITVSASTSGSACGTANSVQASDALRRSLVVKPEGFPQEEVNTAFVCKDSSPTVPKQEMFELALPNNLVPDSQRAWVNIVGDLLAPSAENLERLVRVPTGCGEQNMLGFVPNILVRRYLSEVKLLTESLKSRTTANMITGYQRELRYRRREGSYSAFPERTPPRYKGSLWLTAYVVRSYVAASRYIAIDKADLTISTRWIVSRQESSGAFKPYGSLFHKEMRGGVANGADEAMTAFVVLALLEARDQAAAVSKAVTFLLAATSFNTLYAEILVAHALVAAGKTAAGATRVQRILAKGIRMGGQLHWKGDRSGPVGGSRAVDVEMTSYMVLTLLKLGGSGNLGEAALAIKWVNAQRNSRGGFVSTQDTVVALTALTEFAIATYSPTMAVSVAVTALQNFQTSVQITAANRLLTRQQWLPVPLRLPNQVTFKVTGTGCAVVQSVFRYSTKVAFPDPKFNLNAVITKTKSSCSFTLKVCTSFKEANKESNMAIVEIEMLSGFLTIDSSLRKLEKMAVIERWEFKEGKASLYFNKFSTKEVCFTVRFIRALEVEKLKPAVVRVYDYYAHEDRFEVEYGPPACRT